MALSVSQRFAAVLFNRCTGITRNSTKVGLSAGALSLTVGGRRQCSTPPAPPAALWQLGRLNHVAVACTDLERSAALYRDVLGATRVSDKQALPEHGVYTVFVELANTKIELLAPLGDSSPIRGFLEKNKNGGIHHICIEVDDVAQAMSDVQQRGVRCLSKSPVTGAHGKPVVFLHPKDCNGVLVELEQA